MLRAPMWWARRAASSSSSRWIARHKKDPFVRQAGALGLRSRGAFKLAQLDQRFGLLRPGVRPTARVGSHAAATAYGRSLIAGERALELGCAPGGWTQVLAERGMEVLAVDEITMAPVRGTTFIQGSFTSAETQSEIVSQLNGGTVDLVLSDASPNRSGNHSLDHIRRARSPPPRPRTRPLDSFTRRLYKMMHNLQSVILPRIAQAGLPHCRRAPPCAAYAEAGRCVRRQGVAGLDSRFQRSAKARA